MKDVLKKIGNGLRLAVKAVVFIAIAIEVLYLLALAAESGKDHIFYGIDPSGPGRIQQDQ